jgi:multiple sugar transport system permease protein
MDTSITRQTPGSARRTSAWTRFWGRWNERHGYLFVLPSLVHLLIFLVVPLVFSLWLSFHDWKGPSFQNAPFIGAENYQFMLGDTRFWNALRNSAYYTLLAVPIGMVVSLALAVLMNLKLRGSAFFRTLFFMPVVSSWVAVSVVWITLLDPNAGVINYLLSLVGLPGVNWLGDPNTAMLAIVLVATWKGAGFSMVIWLAGLQAVPKELHEAAAIDGAGAWQSFRFITLPLLAPTTFFLLITGVIGSFQVFSPVYVMTKGGPLDSTDVVVFRIFQRAFQEFKMGYASAQAWVLFAIIFALTLLQLWYMRRQTERTYG